MRARARVRACCVCARACVRECVSASIACEHAPDGDVVGDVLGQECVCVCVCVCVPGGDMVGDVLGQEVPEEGVAATPLPGDERLHKGKIIQGGTSGAQPVWIEPLEFRFFYHARMAYQVDGCTDKGTAW